MEVLEKMVCSDRWFGFCAGSCNVARTGCAGTGEPAAPLGRAVGGTSQIPAAQGWPLTGTGFLMLVWT